MTQSISRESRDTVPTPQDPFTRAQLIGIGVLAVVSGIAVNIVAATSTDAPEKTEPAPSHQTSQ